MEKLQYFLFGKGFLLYTDHKAIEFFNKKIEFGSHRIQRWFERFQRFNFEVIYKKGKDVVASDALSRASGSHIYSAESDGMVLNKTVMEIHKKYNHRRNIMVELKKINIKINKSRMDGIIGECDICCKKDKKQYKSTHHIQTRVVGESVGIDIIRISDINLVLLAIDYFFRKIIGKALLLNMPKKL